MRAILRPRLTVVATALALGPLTSLVGCVGDLDSGPASPRGFECTTGCTELAASTSRFPRLSHDQWEETVRDLLRLPATSDLSSTFPPDAPRGLFDNDGAELSVSGDLRTEYQRAAERLAEQVATDPAALMRILPSDLPASPDAARARGFLEGFGERAYRRPLSSAELDTYAALFARGPELYPDDDPFVAGVRLSLEAMLQSPHFVYRAELGAASGNEPIALTRHELASRLSYALWGTMPDDDLFEAVASGALDDAEGLDVEVSRMLDDARAEAMLVRYHEQLLSVGRYEDVTRSATLFPEFTSAVPAAMADEVRLFVREVYAEDGGVRDLFTSRFTYANAPLAAIYDLPGVSGDAMQRVSLEGTDRAGLLTMAGFLSINASSTDSDPIHRGVFVNHRILCAPLPAPPMMVPPLPPEDMSMPRTLRERITLHTGAGTCGASCHGTMINPVGFAFEHFDAVGSSRDRERNGLAIDAADAYSFQGQSRSYDGAVELSAIVAEQRMTHACYADHLLQFVHGRASVESDEGLLHHVTTASLRERASLRELVRILVTSSAFAQRSATELDELPGLEME
ncbi:MAG: DUF1592 domain-containing protein [Deltaproteobacteria bacterium]|nr:DUF1592 domain-containing protein [Deltaproteobacteria bacterium]